MRKIIIAGYPKSGNTWIARLTGTLVNCPVEGFLYSDHEEIAAEGNSRISEFGVYKSHHQFKELSIEDSASSKIIYVIRDPRDISISGRNYFSLEAKIFSRIDWSKKDLIHNTTNVIKNKINEFCSRLNNKIFIKNEMYKAILYGNQNIHHWCRISWKAHMRPYMDNPEVLKIRYESILSDPLTDSKRILEFLGIEKEEAEILDNIKSNSFSERKEQFLKTNQSDKFQFLRIGKKEQWKTTFSKKEKNLFVDNLKNELIELGYDLDQ